MTAKSCRGIFRVDQGTFSNNHNKGWVWVVATFWVLSFYGASNFLKVDSLLIAYIPTEGVAACNAWVCHLRSFFCHQTWRYDNSCRASKMWRFEWRILEEMTRGFSLELPPKPLSVMFHNPHRDSILQSKVLNLDQRSTTSQITQVTSTPSPLPIFNLGTISFDVDGTQSDTWKGPFPRCVQCPFFISCDHDSFIVRHTIVRRSSSLMDTDIVISMAPSNIKYWPVFLSPQWGA